MHHLNKNFKTWICSIANKLFRFFELQLFITILTWPIFLIWGLPISLLNPIGNLIFAPWITIFLTLSSVIFFLEIVHIQNSIFINLLENINNVFFKTINLANNSFMISCSCPKIPYLFAIPITLFVLIRLKRNLNVYLRTFILFSFSLTLWIVFKYVLDSNELTKTIKNNTKEVICIKNNQNIIIEL